LTDLSRGVEYEGPAAKDVILSHQLTIERSAEMRPYYDLESSLRFAAQNSDKAALRNIIRYSDTLINQPGGKTDVTRILWKAAIDAPPEMVDLILSAPANSFDFLFVDDINGRTCLHTAAMAGMLRLVKICLEKGVPAAKADAYGRSALHYAAMNGHADICRLLLQVKVPADVVDMDNLTPLVHATFKGCVDCIRILLDEGGVAVQPQSMNVDLFPLSIASRTGHLDVVVLLLQHGAESIPNSNGEYPIHLAAREGHVKICELLVHHDGWDVPDKYNEWTPLFHAARQGHDGCIRVLLKAGCRVDAVDEFGNSPMHYAGWHGHHACVTLLLEAASKISTPYQTPRSDFSPAPAMTPTEDMDMIPSLSLPPPIMPYRAYGHNYLDKNCLVQISIGHASPVWSSQTHKNCAVRLHLPFMGTEYQYSYLHSSPLFKLVMTASQDATSAPYSVPLPLAKHGVLFSFQVPSVDDLSLEFSLYPNFGTKTIGRAVALPALLRNAQAGSSQALPILDHRLHVIGEVNDVWSLALEYCSRFVRYRSV
jgi:CDK inhibitor PHO81